MTAQEIQKRNGKAQQLRVIQVDNDNFYVESSEGKICYKVVISNEHMSCSCGDFARGILQRGCESERIPGILHNSELQNFKEKQIQ